MKWAVKAPGASESGLPETSPAPICLTSSGLLAKGFGIPSGGGKPKLGPEPAAGVGSGPSGSPGGASAAAGDGALVTGAITRGRSLSGSAG